MEFLRAVLGFIGIGCASMSARALVRARKGGHKRPNATAWPIRAVLCLGGVMFRHPIDWLDVAVWILMPAAAAVAGWVAAHPKPQEDLTGTIFPGED